ncbi:MAG: hypothetical protein EZS26_002874 [Candidatus Ordinivivax streblomastigis]|uniref:Uncharacterized protein n=1 Tax=Candidatus Ordinivivax streblomastigis TaxID=2540710 RepID=A0A5M8NVU8_9BACT|nr:MAG: hypothetical protein EZS26_002874 [Candidatus Ordinivivax streblomastigis]
MKIKPTFNPIDLHNYLHSKVDEWTEILLTACKEACIKTVARAKQTNACQDQTGALRSSIGYVLYHNGVEIAHSFESTGGEKGEEGAQTGLAFARKKASEAGDKTIVAIVVAGMDYAIYMESKGRDVLTGSARQFADELKKHLIEKECPFGFPTP